MPAESAELYCLDGVYTRMGAGDDLAADMSTFMVRNDFVYTTYHRSCLVTFGLVLASEILVVREYPLSVDRTAVCDRAMIWTRNSH